MGRVPIEDDLELAAAPGEELADQAVGVAEFGNADLSDQVEDGGFLKDSGLSQVDSGAGIDDHIIEVLARDGEQFVNGLRGGLDG